MSCACARSTSACQENAQVDEPQPQLCIAVRICSNSEGVDKNREGLTVRNSGRQRLENCSSAALGLKLEPAIPEPQRDGGLAPTMRRLNRSGAGSDRFAGANRSTDIWAAPQADGASPCAPRQTARAGHRRQSDRVHQSGRARPSPLTASASRSQREAAMRFILVNGSSAGDQHCALCCEKIDDTYLREMQTRLLYCDSRCSVDTSHFCAPGAEARARKAS